MPPPSDPPPDVPPVPPESGVRSRGGELPEPRRPGGRISWETAEYRRSNGLALIDASGGYAGRAAGRPGGGGITVAVLDDGIDFSHPDLAPGRFDGETAFRSELLSREHGTPVAGIVAARRDGSGVHGVAWNANLRSVATCGIGGGCAGRVADAGSVDAVATSVDAVATSIASAAGLARTYGDMSSDPAASSHIVNMSFAYPGFRDVPRIAGGTRPGRAGSWSPSWAIAATAGTSAPRTTAAREGPPTAIPAVRSRSTACSRRASALRPRGRRRVWPGRRHVLRRPARVRRGRGGVGRVSEQGR